MRAGPRLSPAALAIVSIAAVLTSCSGEEPPTTSSAPTTVTVESSPAGEGSWSSFDTPVGSTAEIHVVAAVDGGYLAAGTQSGGLAVWWSDDLSQLDLVYSEPCCDRYLSITTIAQFGDRILMGATGESVATDGSRTARSWLFVSRDHGVSWDEIDDPAFTTANQYLVRLLVTDGAVIADVSIDDRTSGFGPISDPWRSSDLVEWSRVELPAAEPDDRPSFQSDGTSLWAVAPRGQSTVAWRSDDGGKTFQSLPPLLEYPNATAAVGGNLVVWPQVLGSGSSTTTDTNVETGPWVLAPGESWRQLPSDTGQWGDGRVRIWGAIDPTTGQFVAIVFRIQRSDRHYCFDDPQTCETPEIVLVTSTDGIEWFDIDGAELTYDLSNHWPLLVGDGSIVVARLERSTRLQVRRWSGPGLPGLIDPAIIPAPDRPVPLYEGGELAVGDERRYELGLGYCGGMYVDGISWVPTEPLPDPLPDAWPSRAVEIADGPTGYLYGRITRTAQDRIEFAIEGEGTVATYVPETPDPNRGGCG